MFKNITGFIREVLTRSSWENPSVDFTSALLGTPSDSGVPVTVKSILGYPAVWRGVNLIARDVAKLPLIIYERVKEGKERATEHPAYRLLKNRPNSYQTAFQFRMSMQMRAILWGNAYAVIIRNAGGEPVELIQLPPNGTSIVRAREGQDDPGKVWVITGPSQDIRIPYRDVLHIRGMGTDLSGFSLVDIAKNSLGLGLAAQKYGNKFFANDARPSVTLETDAVLEDIAYDRILKSWNKMHQGVNNSSKAAILEQGLKVNPFSMSNKDSQFLELRQFERVEVANWLLLQPHKVGDSSRVSYNSLEQENQAYLNESLDPWLVAWEQECETKLFTTDQKKEDTHIVEFVRQALLRADMPSRFEAYVKAINNGIMTPDEVRTRENLNIIPNGGGTNFYIPANLALVTGANTVVPMQGVTNSGQRDGGRSLAHAFSNFLQADDKARRDLIKANSEAIHDQLSRMITRIKNAQKRGNFDIAREREVITSACRPAVRAAELSLRLDLDLDGMVDRLIGATPEQLGNGFADTIVGDLFSEIERN